MLLEQMFHLTRSQLSRSGLKVYTTLNFSLQQGILNVMLRHIASEQGASPAQPVDDAPTTFNNPGVIPPTYTPLLAARMSDRQPWHAAPGSHSRPGSNRQSAMPHCGTYAFAFAPPAGNGIPANRDWW